MTESVVTVTEDTPLSEAALLLTQRSFNGLPVVDKNGKLVGLFSERDMVSDSSYIHLKTLLKLFSSLEFYKKDHSPIKKELKQIMALKVKNIMSTNPAVIHPNDSIESAVSLFANPANNPLPVVGADNKLLGIISMSDLTKLYGISTNKIMNEKNIDKQINSFVDKFEQEFVVVTRFRVSTWFVASLFFTFVGFAIAMFFILRIS